MTDQIIDIHWGSARPAVTLEISRAGESRGFQIYEGEIRGSQGCPSEPATFLVWQVREDPKNSFTNRIQRREPYGCDHSPRPIFCRAYALITSQAVTSVGLGVELTEILCRDRPASGTTTKKDYVRIELKPEASHE